MKQEKLNEILTRKDVAESELEAVQLIESTSGMTGNFDSVQATLDNINRQIVATESEVKALLSMQM